MSVTPWIGLFQIENVVLRHYCLPDQKLDQNLDKRLNKPIVLILFGLVNSPDILDLYPNRSLIRRFLEKGMDVYVIDWGEPPNILEKKLLFQDYVSYLLQIINYLNRNDLHLIGVCTGGMISLLFAALYPDYYKKLVLFLSPVDFSYQNDFIRSFSCIPVDKIVKNFGHISGVVMAKSIALFSPYSAEFKVKKVRKISEDRLNKKNSSFYEALADWAYQSPAHAGFAFQEFVNEYIHQNKLVKQSHLTNIHKPILNIFASADHLWPPESSKGLKKYLRNNIDYTEIEFIGGHLSALISKEAQTLIPSQIAEFIFCV